LTIPGIVQTALRDLTGWARAITGSPEIRSLGGPALNRWWLVLYPYVLTAGACGLLQQSANEFLAARALGQQCMGRVSLRSACRWRPCDCAGRPAEVMETIADFRGPRLFWGAELFATGIYTSWFSPVRHRGCCAAQLALVLAQLWRCCSDA